MQDDLSDPDAIRQLVRALGEAGGARAATPDDIARLRDFFGLRVLRSTVDAYIRAKYDEHVGVRDEWPAMMSDEQALRELRYLGLCCERMRRLDFGDDDEAVRERMALHAEWDDAIGQLPRIVEAYEHGRLSVATVAELRRLAHEVSALLPEIARIRFRRPDAGALARALQDVPARTA